MTYLIDAWLERSNPCLRIIETATGKVCATLDEACLQEMREQAQGVDTQTVPLLPR